MFIFVCWGFISNMSYGMKNLIIMAVSILSLIGCASNNNKVSEKKLVSYTYFSRGSMAQPYDDIDVRLSEVGDSCIVKLFVLDEGMFYTYHVDTLLLQKINSIIAEHKIYSYKNHYQSLLEILDGDTWSCSAHYADGYYITSGGYHAWPDDDGLKIINSLIKETVAAGKLVSTKAWSLTD